MYDAAHWTRTSRVILEPDEEQQVDEQPGHEA
jgi:hypothetical protein